jgi:hypothetical protein
MTPESGLPYAKGAKMREGRERIHSITFFFDFFFRVLRESFAPFAYGSPDSSQLPQRLHLPRQPELAQRRQADALVHDLEAVALDLAQ